MHCRSRAAEAIDAARKRLPGAPHIATFDTAFHSTLSAEAYTYPVPFDWEHRWGVRRYGFHGLSHAYCSRRAAELLGRPFERLRTIVLHLGHGCSASAVDGGRSVDTSMGFTPLEGLMMATRSGSIDPSIALHVQRHGGLSPDEVDRALNFESGLAGVSGLSGDMRVVLEAAKAGHERAQLALAIYVRRIRQTIGAYAATLGGLDALVFTAGVGERSPEIRAAVCDPLGILGILIEPSSNVGCRPNADVSSPTSRVRVLVIETRGEATMFSLNVFAVRLGRVGEPSTRVRGSYVVSNAVAVTRRSRSTSMPCSGRSESPPCTCSLNEKWPLQPRTRKPRSRGTASIEIKWSDALLSLTLDPESYANARWRRRPTTFHSLLRIRVSR